MTVCYYIKTSDFYDTLTELQKELDNIEFITRPKDLTDIPDDFLKKIEDFFKKKN